MGGAVRSVLRHVLPPILLDAARWARRRVERTTRTGRATPDGDFSIPTRALDDAFPDIPGTSVILDVATVGAHDEWQLPLKELVAIGAICRHLRPRKILEFGTYLGSTTLVMALNTPRETEILTLDLDPNLRQTHRHGLGVGLPEFSVGSAFRARPEESRIRQLLGDSRTFDFEPFTASVDLVFIDSDHTFEFVKRDTDSALRILRPGGTIVWDDYRWDERHPECGGVTRCVNELSARFAVFALKDTRLAVLTTKTRS